MPLDTENALSTYDFNKTVSITYTVLDADTGVPVDPASVSFSYYPGSSALLPVTLTLGVDDTLIRVDVGVFRVTVILDQGGFWVYRWYSTNPNDGEDGMLFVEPPVPPVPPVVGPV